jgi:hypothetical protein
MDKKMLAPMMGWVGAVAASLALAFAVPSETAVLGRVPSIAAKRLDQRQIQLPQELPAGRTLAVVVFRGNQRAEAQSWIDGLDLARNSAIEWLKMPVLNDPGDEGLRMAIESRLLSKHGGAGDRARLVPIFTDREAFVRAAGLSSAEHASILVLDRAGNVLARAEGAFDEGKAQALRETVLAQND